MYCLAVKTFSFGSDTDKDLVRANQQMLINLVDARGGKD